MGRRGKSNPPFVSFVYNGVRRFVRQRTVVKSDSFDVEEDGWPVDSQKKKKSYRTINRPPETVETAVTPPMEFIPQVYQPQLAPTHQYKDQDVQTQTIPEPPIEEKPIQTEESPTRKQKTAISTGQGYFEDTVFQQPYETFETLFNANGEEISDVGMYDFEKMLQPDVGRANK